MTTPVCRQAKQIPRGETHLKLATSGTDVTLSKLQSALQTFPAGKYSPHSVSRYKWRRFGKTGVSRWPKYAPGVTTNLPGDYRDRYNPTESETLTHAGPYGRRAVGRAAETQRQNRALAGTRGWFKRLVWPVALRPVSPERSALATFRRRGNPRVSPGNRGLGSGRGGGSVNHRL